MPLISPLKLPVPRKDSRPGISMIAWCFSPFRLPTVRIENGALRLGRVETLGRRHLHGLDLGHDLAGDVAADGDAEAGDQQDRGADRATLRRKVSLIAPSLRCMLHSDDPDHERAAGEVRRQHDVRERHELDLVEQHGEEVVELGAAGLRVVGVAHRVLHPGVRGQDEVRREQRADVHQPDAGVVELAARAGPSRRSTGRGTSTRGRTRAGPRPPAARRRCRRRSGSRRSSSCRTGTPARSRSRRRARS